MKNFSRKIVLLSLLVIWLSSLGTNAILLEAQNLGQNGYIKYSNGLLIQWGLNTSSFAGNRTTYLPVSFMNAEYIIIQSIYANGVNIENAIYSSALISKSSSSFVAANRFWGNVFGYSTLPINWFAIGKWNNN